MTDRIFKKGDIVGLKAHIREQMRGIIPEGREDNSEAQIRAVYGSHGEVWLDQDLHGMKYWNQEDLILIKAVDE